MKVTFVSTIMGLKRKMKMKLTIALEAKIVIKSTPETNPL